LSWSPKTKCCRSTPRCRNCPVLTRRFPARTADERAALIEEVFRGIPPRELPPVVREALTTLRDARERTPA
jgi:hypothetical protein